MIGHLFYKIGEFLASTFSLAFAYKVGIFFATCQFLFSKKDRLAVMNNLRIICPAENEAELRRKCKNVFINFGLYLAEFFRYKKIDKEFVNRHFTLVGFEHIDSALTKGKGAILLTAHMGNWELGGMAFGLLGYRIAAIALDHKNKKINQFFKIRRESKGIENISLGVSAKRSLRALSENKLLAIVGDRDFSNTGYPMRFLGREKKIPRGPIVLSLRSGAPVIPVIVSRQPNRDLKMECFPPLTISSNQGEEEILQQYVCLLEDQIRKLPTQWLLFREFWKE